MLKDEKHMSHINYQTNLTHDILEFKKVLIDWLFEIGERFRQTNLTIHIAIAYLERAYELKLHYKDKYLKSE